MGYFEIEQPRGPDAQRNAGIALIVLAVCFAIALGVIWWLA